LSQNEISEKAKQRLKQRIAQTVIVFQY